MGSFISSTAGYGLMIPYAEEEYTNAPKEWEILVGKYDGDMWDLFQDLLKDYKDLVWEQAYFQDYTGCVVIYVDELSESAGGMFPLHLPDKIMYEPDTFEYDKQLLEIATKIGMPLEEVGPNLGIWGVVSYG